MKYLLPFLFLGCAHTEVWENGQRVFRTEMNCTYMSYTSPSRSQLVVHGMNHSTPTRAGKAYVDSLVTGAVMFGAGARVP